MDLEVDKIWINTVDGRNPAPVEVGSLSPIFTMVLYIPGGFLAGFVNHQHYGQISPRNHLDLFSMNQEKLTESVDTLTKQGRACPRWLSGIPRLAKELVKYANGMGQLLDNLQLFHYDRFFSDVWFCMSCFVLSTMVNW